LARQVADDTNTLMAGNISNTTAYEPDDKRSQGLVREMFKESIQWAVQEGADLIIAETFPFFGEAMIALECMKQYAPGLDHVVNMIPLNYSPMKTLDGVAYGDACAKLHALGATVVGLNCMAGPKIMVEYMERIRETYHGPLAALPSPYRTTPDVPQFQQLIVAETGKRATPDNLDMFLCSQEDVQLFGDACKRLDIQFAGLCCGNSARYTRTLATTLGSQSRASSYAADFTQHHVFGSDPNLKNFYKNEIREKIEC